MRIQPRAEFLHSVGPQETVRHFADLVRPFIEGLVLSVARIDLFCDMEGMELRGEDRRGFVCRGDDCTTEDGHLPGFAFGSRRTRRISARFYDKTAEMASKGHATGGRSSGATVIGRGPGVADRVRDRKGGPQPTSSSSTPTPCWPLSRRSGRTAPGSG